MLLPNSDIAWLVLYLGLTFAVLKLVLVDILRVQHGLLYFAEFIKVTIDLKMAEVNHFQSVAVLITEGAK